MKWEKRGLTYRPTEEKPWARSHASTPFAEHIADDCYRVYFSSRDEKNRSSIGWLEMDVAKNKVERVGDEPIVVPGRPGAFDDSGASMGWLVTLGNTKYLYYLGWNLGVTVPWRNAIGLAKSVDGGPFMKHSEAPVMDRSADDPFSLSYPCVVNDDLGWRMLYGSNLSWGPLRDHMQHVIKCGSSEDGINWDCAGVVLDLKPNEYAIARPSECGDEIWYSYKGADHHYRIGYAARGERRDHEAGIDVSETGWDSEAVGYAHVFVHKGQKYMLYNGNGHGLTGFGLAVEE